jgi:ribonuclease HII
MRIPYPTFIEEQILWKSGVTHIAGVDEVGRGAFAGPVVTAAVLLRPDFPLTLGVHDSKLLKQNALSYFIDEVCVDCINKEGIGKSTQKSFSNSISNLSLQPEFILVDAFYIDSIDKTIQKPIIKGDQISLSIAAASILAKVYRDHLMEKLGETYPQYSFAINKGYGTSAHRAALKEFGLTNLHRTSFSLEKYITT